MLSFVKGSKTHWTCFVNRVFISGSGCQVLDSEGPPTATPGKVPRELPFGAEWGI
jgi:hypothetical protein